MEFRSLYFHCLTSICVHFDWVWVNLPKNTPVYTNLMINEHFVQIIKSSRAFDAVKSCLDRLDLYWINKTSITNISSFSKNDLIFFTTSRNNGATVQFLDSVKDKMSNHYPGSLLWPSCLFTLPFREIRRHLKMNLYYKLTFIHNSFKNVFSSRVFFTEC